MQVPGQDWISRWARYQPQAPAVHDMESGRILTYSQLNAAGNRLAVYFAQELGLNSGDRLAVLAENGAGYIALFAAAQKTGLILVPLNYRLASPELDYLLRDARPQAIIWEPKFEELLSACPAFSGAAHKIPLVSVEGRAFSGEKDPGFDFRPVAEDHPIFILYTSGTTGFPKGALYTHKMLFWNSINTAMSLLLNQGSRTITCLPPFHTGGWNVLTTPILHHGGTVSLMKKVEPERLLRGLEEERATIFMGVPTVLKMMSESEHWETADLSHLHYAIVGGEPMPLPLIEQWHAKGIPVRQGFGMTEVGPNLTSLHQRDAKRKKGSIGFPNFYVDVRVVDKEGREVDAGQPGELLFRGPMVTPGYWQNPKATEEAIRGGWFHSGDMAVRDEEGYLFIVDRIKNMFISGGENVYPAEVERSLNGHPAIAGSLVVGVPDGRWGEVGFAFVQLAPGQKMPDLKAYCKNRMATFKVPKYFHPVDALPVSATGKIDRRSLKKVARDLVGK